MRGELILTTYKSKLDIDIDIDIDNLLPKNQYSALLCWSINIVYTMDKIMGHNKQRRISVGRPYTLYAAQATGVVNLELAPARFLFQKV